MNSNPESLTPTPPSDTPPVRRVAFLVAHEGIERIELDAPWAAVVEAGHQPVLLSTRTGTVQTFEHLDRSEEREVDGLVDAATIDEYDALVLPGGVANPDALRLHRPAVELVHAFATSTKPLAAVCHAPWMLVEADVVKGRRVTSWPSLATDLRNAGAQWVDERVVHDGNLVTSRKPDDLPAFIGALLEAIAHGDAAAAPHE